jgi:hypothetical protein
MPIQAERQPSSNSSSAGNGATHSTYFRCRGSASLPTSPSPVCPLSSFSVHPRPSRPASLYSIIAYISDLKGIQNYTETKGTPHGTFGLTEERGWLETQADVDGVLPGYCNYCNDCTLETLKRKNRKKRRIAPLQDDVLAIVKINAGRPITATLSTAHRSTLQRSRSPSPRSPTIAPSGPLGVARWPCGAPRHSTPIWRQPYTRARNQKNQAFHGHLVKSFRLILFSRRFPPRSARATRVTRVDFVVFISSQVTNHNLTSDPWPRLDFPH